VSSDGLKICLAANCILTLALGCFNATILLLGVAIYRAIKLALYSMNQARRDQFINKVNDSYRGPAADANYKAAFYDNVAAMPIEVPCVAYVKAASILLFCCRRHSSNLSDHGMFICESASNCVQCE